MKRIICQGFAIDADDLGNVVALYFDFQTPSGKTGLRKVDDATVVGFFNRLYQAVKGDAEVMP